MTGSLKRREFIKLSSKTAAFTLLPCYLAAISNYNMERNKSFDVIIIGGSYSGLAAGMALGRALRNVLIIDSGKPCNIQTPHSHNFLTNDGKKPVEISALANLQVKRYETVQFFNGLATTAVKTGNGFDVKVETGEIFSTKKLIFATGIKDILPPIDGLDECWGISVIHCPYCHGYEVRNEETGILANGNTAFDFTKLIYNWAKDVTLFTNGKATLSEEQIEGLKKHQIKVVEDKIEKLEHINGYIQNVVFTNGSKFSLKAIYAPVPFEQHCKIPEALGCNLTEEGYIKIDTALETSVKDVFAIGDNSTRMRTVANAVSMGTTAGIIVSKKIILEEF